MSLHAMVRNSSGSISVEAFKDIKKVLVHGIFHTMVAGMNHRTQFFMPRQQSYSTAYVY